MLLLLKSRYCTLRFKYECSAGDGFAYVGSAQDLRPGRSACGLHTMDADGAMSPATTAGTLAQVLAEALASLTLVQLVNPGAPY